MVCLQTVEGQWQRSFTCWKDRRRLKEKEREWILWRAHSLTVCRSAVRCPGPGLFCEGCSDLRNKASGPRVLKTKGWKGCVAVVCRLSPLALHQVTVFLLQNLNHRHWADVKSLVNPVSGLPEKCCGISIGIGIRTRRTKCCGALTRTALLRELKMCVLGL
jgi:hypothetical protein